MDDAVKRVIHFMEDRLDEPVTIDDMAKAAKFSKFHFTRLFRRETGLSPARFLSALRIEEAKRLLVTTTLRVADISLLVGYTSVGTFTTRFTTSVGVSPTRYRRGERPPARSGGRDSAGTHIPSPATPPGEPDGRRGRPQPSSGRHAPTAGRLNPDRSRHSGGR